MARWAGVSLNDISHEVEIAFKIRQCMLRSVRISLGSAVEWNPLIHRGQTVVRHTS
jgi:hypothetical protein